MQRKEMPTCGITGIASNCNSWDEFADSDCKLILFDFPKNQV
jgi:hypothetical protein